jgi:hypothetical protein
MRLQIPLFPQQASKIESKSFIEINLNILYNNCFFFFTSILFVLCAEKFFLIVLARLLNFVFMACKYEYLIDRNQSIWCKFLDNSMLKVLQYREDIRYNCKFGYKYNITKQMTCDLIENLLYSFELMRAE